MMARTLVTGITEPMEHNSQGDNHCEKLYLTLKRQG